MKRGFLVVFLCVIFCCSCNAQSRQKIALNGTKWACKIAEACINTYEFTSDSTFTFLSCEMEDQYFGNYYIKDGFLILVQKGSIYDENFSDASMHKAERKMYKVEIKKDTLKHLVMSDWVNDKWIQSDFRFDDAYVYRKVD